MPIMKIIYFAFLLISMHGYCQSESRLRNYIVIDFCGTSSDKLHSRIVIYNDSSIKLTTQFGIPQIHYFNIDSYIYNAAKTFVCNYIYKMANDEYIDRTTAYCIFIYQDSKRIRCFTVYGEKRMSSYFNNFLAVLKRKNIKKEYYNSIRSLLASFMDLDQLN